MLQILLTMNCMHEGPRLVISWLLQGNFLNCLRNILLDMCQDSVTKFANGPTKQRAV